MADDTDPTTSSSGSMDPGDADPTLLIPEPETKGWQLRPTVFIVVGFIVVVVGAVLIARNTGGDDDLASTDAGVDEPTEPTEPAADDESPDDEATTTDDSSDQGGGRDSSGDESAAEEPASEAASMFGGGGDWLVPWGDGFLRFGMIYQPQPLPEFDGTFAELFPPEVLDLILESGVTNVEEATDLLVEAGLYEQVIDIVNANPEVADWLFGVEPPAPVFEVSQSSDGLDWSMLDGISIPGGESISWVESDGQHLVVGSHTYEMTDDTGPGNTTIQVAVTSDLQSWEVHDITGSAGAGVPDVVQLDTSMGGLAIGPDGWVASTNTYAYIDEWALLPEDIRNTDGWWDLTADETGLTVDIYEPEYEVTYDEDGYATEEFSDENCCEVSETRHLTWDEVGTDHTTWQQYRNGGNDSMDVWTASWGSAPTRTEVPAYGRFGSLAHTGAGFLAVSWTEDSPGNVMLFSGDGRSWTESGSPTGVVGDWIDQIVAVEGGVIATVSTENGQQIMLSESTGSSWREIDVPGIPDNTWIWFAPGSGSASLFDATDYSAFDHGCFEPGDSVYVDIELGEHYVFIESWAEGTTLFVETVSGNEGGNYTEAHSDVRYPDGTPEFLLFDDAAGEVAFVDPETGDEVVRMPTADFLAAWDEAVAEAEARIAECADFDESQPFPDPDYWLAATTDGATWLVENIDEGVEPYPQQAAVNGNIVVTRLGDTWSRFTIG